MSLNLTLSDPQTGDSFPLLQTPTEVTHEILEKRDKYQAYVRWFRSSRDWNWKSPPEAAIYQEHKTALKRWLAKHPNSSWGRC